MVSASSLNQSCRSSVDQTPGAVQAGDSAVREEREAVLVVGSVVDVESAVDEYAVAEAGARVDAKRADAAAGAVVDLVRLDAADLGGVDEVWRGSRNRLVPVAARRSLCSGHAQEDIGPQIFLNAAHHLLMDAG